ncbi:hypothetical protein LTR66_003977, partial [Elasticomyces elasticus]
METPPRDHDSARDPYRDSYRYESSDPSNEASGMSSIDNSRPGSSHGPRPKDKKRVNWTGGGESLDAKNHRASFNIRDENTSPHMTGPQPEPSADSGTTSPSRSRVNSVDDVLSHDGRSHLPTVPDSLRTEVHKALGYSTHSLPRPRPAIRRGGSGRSPAEADADGTPDNELDRSARVAYEKAKRLEREEGVRSEPASRRPSPSRLSHQPFARSDNIDVSVNGVPSLDMPEKAKATTVEDTIDESDLPMEQPRSPSSAEAHKLVRAHTRIADNVFVHEVSNGLRSGAVTPIEEQEAMHEYVPRPQHFRGGVLGALLKLYNQSGESRRNHHRNLSGQDTSLLGGYSSRTSLAGTPAGSRSGSPDRSPPTSGASTPEGTRNHKAWFTPRSHSTSSLAQLVGSSAMGASPVVSGLGEEVSKRLRQGKRPGAAKRTSSGSALQALSRLGRPRLEDEIRITVHIAETIMRQKYLLKLCRALMQYGAPTHRLEEYLKMSARVLEIDGQFLYIPSCMFMSFDDPSTHTTEVKLVRVTQGLDLGKLRDTHEVYKDVVHDRIGVEEATQRLDEVNGRKPKFNPWALIPVYGLAAASVGPFAFGARLIDLPFAFVLGCVLGVLQLIVAPRSDLYANVFEISAAVLTSFLARAIGSISGGNLFCFSALAQSSIALILPGYTVLCASLELQSRSIVAGSVRMVYAIIYSLFLGFGITIGTAIYGVIDHNATSAIACDHPMEPFWFFFAVP